MRRPISSPSRSHHRRAPFLLAACASLAVFAASGGTAAQTRTGSATTTPPPAANAAPATAQEGDSYHIGAGDVLDVRVFNRPQLSRDAVRVDGRGMIRMPLIEGEIQAACRTESDLAREIETRYLKYQRNPHVDVFVKEFQSQPVAVIGAVNLPGRFQLQRPMRLLELLTFAGGPSERAGGRLQVAHSVAPSPCEAKPGAPAPGEGGTDEDASDVLSSYRLNDTLRGVDQSNPFVRPGDIVNLPEAEQAFIVGNVLRPSTIDLKEPVTVSRAIAMAGGTMPDTKRERVRILRQTPGSTSKQEIFVDLGAIEKRRAEDVALQADDIVDVPIAGGKRMLRSLVSGIFPAAGQLPVQIISGQVPTAATRRR
ncbi:MAG TPA: polysaccharide biosynthesis/export family protein [Pyrinomonadaceae bacterium]|jgi:polysaccharide export outer membrane protein|nr:polysaccharide biosynthesis/export family protein [Pyrinomonadaceae bacterium]